MPPSRWASFAAEAAVPEQLVPYVRAVSDLEPLECGGFLAWRSGPALAVVETAGVGYGLNISLNTYTAIQGKQEVKLYVHEVLVAGGRDDSFTLFGFATKQERELYRLLITVSGVGGNTARMILSSLSPRELCEIISTGNDKMLKTVKGIGLKTAQRIIIDLKDKIVSLGIADELPASGGNVVMVNNDVKDEAVSALTMLGFSPAPSAKVVVDILKAQPVLRGD